MVAHQAHNLRMAVRIGPPQQEKESPDKGFSFGVSLEKGESL